MSRERFSRTTYEKLWDAGEAPEDGQQYAEVQPLDIIEEEEHDET